MFRTLLAILVGLSLTLICQGHKTTGKHSRPHVSLLGESNVGLAQNDPLPVISAPHAYHAGHTNHSHDTQEQEHTLPSSSNLPFSIPQPEAIMGSTMLDVAQGVDSLSMQVVIIFAALCYVLRRYSMASGRQLLLAIGTGPPPDHPPPRHFSLSPAA